VNCLAILVHSPARRALYQTNASGTVARFPFWTSAGELYRL